MNIYNFSSVRDLPPHCTVLIYGAGGRGGKMLSLLTNKRPDIEILGFVDSYKEGFFNEYTVYSLSQLKQTALFSQDVKIIIASHHAPEICHTVLSSTSFDVYMPDLFLVHETRDFSLKESDFEWFSSGLADISPIFHRDRDKRFLELLPDFFFTRDGYENSMNEIIDFHLKFDELYFDYINKQTIKVAIDGGMEIGNTTLRFLHHFPGVQVHGFEPYSLSFRTSPY
ncbi:MAG: hypothetical protein HQK81_10315 [Desulfovibrionaceae bacterium]|nr:hypothetical protein [Desulfovibrionaceae bacterium]MBF0514435.1 hypothetical protein [Desulfovibrionaceae bacterium]